ncbi:MAG: 30S ribosomal protein S8e [Candidatus Diapherotrites archaeon]|jgi:small subunit ribosomal protein S8e|uniref:30S ribosomal protein S8e n=1 Tax=Candidatus Iainarchaeum sp. TaxID=3101447 RepID=A0A8T5GFW9_9ARCH|nr:30S ribosomal protein S8e [Candidatus Diapherotrites archaeon]MBT7241267.1 30S ribosomal protein S8e [Candidatus Diapherotrites archaeon]
MVEWHTKSDKMKSGGKRKTLRRCTKKKAWMGGSAANTKTHTGNEDKREVNEGRGKTAKVRATSIKFANIYNNGKTVKAEIIGVSENNSNRLFARSNTSTKGALLNVKLDGKETTVKVTNRPGQDGVINAILA